MSQRKWNVSSARDASVGYSVSFSGFELEIPLGGAIKLVGIGETASSSSAAVEGDLDKVGDGLAYSVLTLGSERLEDGDSPGLTVFVLVCLQNCCNGAGDAMLSTSS